MLNTSKANAPVPSRTGSLKQRQLHPAAEKVLATDSAIKQRGCVEKERAKRIEIVGEEGVLTADYRPPGFKKQQKDRDY